MPKLQISLLEHGEVNHELTVERISVGRHPDNLIQIDDASISTHHAELKRVGEGYVLKDLNSTNGTRVNDAEVQDEQTLALGDRIRFGKVEALYVSDSESAAMPPMESPETESVGGAEVSQRPENFSNHSPFRTKKIEKTPGGMVSLLIAAAAIAFFLYVLFEIAKLQA